MHVIVTVLTRSVSLENQYKECGWATLSQRRQQHKLSFMYNVNSGTLNIDDSCQIMELNESTPEHRSENSKYNSSETFYNNQKY